jgi:hypothetical protein
LRVIAIRFCGWALQQFFAWWVPVLAVGAVFTLPGLNELTGSPLGNVGIQIVHAIAVGAAGCLMGLSARLTFPSAKATGRWIWVLPVSVLLLAATSDVRTLGWRTVFEDFFFHAHPGRDEGPVLRDLLTYPALSCLCYSLAMVFRKSLGVRRA